MLINCLIQFSHDAAHTFYGPYHKNAFFVGFLPGSDTIQILKKLFRLSSESLVIYATVV